MTKGNGRLDWGDVGRFLGRAAPALGLALGGPAGAAVGGLVAQALKVEASPEAVLVAAQEPGGLIEIAKLALEHEQEIERLVLQAEVEQAKQTNDTYRSELASEDPYVRRARPGFVYALKWTWIAQVCTTFGAAVVAIFADALGDRVDAARVLQALAELNADTTLLWGPALGVIGIYNYARSKDKQVAAGQAPGSILDAFRRK